ncbi:MAG: ATPase domain-containing protein [Byssovorax sp.]
MPAPSVGRVTSPPMTRVSSGLAELDRMLHGGFLFSDSILLAGPAGTGKTMLTTHFIAAGVANGERGVILVFEEQPNRYLERVRSTGVDLRKMVADGDVEILYLRPVDLSVDETLHIMVALVNKLQARRLVIDSLSGFELAVAPSFRDDFRESLYRTMATLSALGVTVMMTVEVLQSFTDLRFSPYEISFIADTLILQRYVEMEGQLRRVLTILKMRGSAHDTRLRLYEVTDQGIHIGSSLEEYRGILTGIPGRIAKKKRRGR